MQSAGVEIADRFTRCFNQQDESIVALFTQDALFGFIQSTDQQERSYSACEALQLLVSEGVTQIMLNTEHISIEGDRFSLFYCTYDGKPHSVALT